MDALTESIELPDPDLILWPKTCCVCYTPFATHRVTLVISEAAEDTRNSPAPHMAVVAFVHEGCGESLKGEGKVMDAVIAGFRRPRTLYMQFKPEPIATAPR